MKNLAKFSVDRAITIFMAVIIVIVFGIVSYTNLTTDLFPSMNIPYSVVVTTYPGASPTEVEDVVTNPLEDALATTTNVKELTSMSQENFSLVILEFNSDTNMDSAIIEMRETLDMTTAGMPDMVGNPMIIKLNPDMMPIMQLSVSKGDLDQRDLTEYVFDTVVPQLEKVSGVASVSVSGAYESEVQVVIKESVLDSKNDEIKAINAQFITMMGVDAPQLPLLTKELIGQILQAQNFEYPVGYANIADPAFSNGTYLVRVGDEFDTTDEISSLTVFTFPGMLNPAFNPETDPVEMMYVVNPLLITMNEITSIDFVNANEKEYSKVNGDNAISISIQKSSEFATTDVTDEINNVLSRINEVDTDTDFTVLLDQGEYIEFATGSVVNNLMYGAILAIIVLIIFLRSARATFIVGISIPISLMFAIVLIYFSGITLNIVSLGGLALGIGMLVDNSIVVMENIFRMKKLGYSNKDAAIEGTKQVAGAIFASTITTISVFVPVVFIEGFIREVFMEMALTIAYSLVASLLIALTLVPAISSKILKEDEETITQQEQDSTWAKRTYEKVFNFAFKFKYIVMAVVLVLFGGFIYLATSNGFEYFPVSDEGQLNISISNPVDAPLNTDDFFEKLDEISEDLLDIEEVEVVGITLGGGQMSFLGATSSNSASASVVLKDDRTRTTSEVEVIINNLLMNDYDMIEYSISGSQQQTSMLTGSGYQVELRGYDLDVLKAEATKIASLIGSVDGVIEVDNGVGIPADEIKLTIDKEKAVQYGYMTAIVAGQIVEMLKSEEVITTIQQGGTTYDVYIYDSSSNYSGTTYTVDGILNHVLGMAYDGSFIKVRDLLIDTNEDGEITAEDVVVEGFTTINHSNGIRSLTISATFDPDYNASFVAQDIDSVMNDYNTPDGYEFEIQGENEEIMEALSTLVLAMVLAIALIYMIMASQFQSLTYPLIIMFTIPLAFTGGFAILYFAGMPISVVAMIGFIILVGVVVNNGIVFVDYTNQLREKGLPVKEALLEAGKTRLRPIVMTALTTILALITMALGVGDGAEMMQPMAVTTIGGLTYATVLTLVIVPIMYYLFTEYTRNIMLGLGIIVVLIASIGAYVYFSLWYILLLGGVLLLAFVLGFFLPRKKAI